MIAIHDIVDRRDQLREEVEGLTHSLTLEREVHRLAVEELETCRGRLNKLLPLVNSLLFCLQKFSFKDEPADPDTLEFQGLQLSLRLAVIATENGVSEGQALALLVRERESQMLSVRLVTPRDQEVALRTAARAALWYIERCHSFGNADADREILDSLLSAIKQSESQKKETVT